MRTNIRFTVLFCLFTLALSAQIPVTVEPFEPYGPITTVKFDETEFDFGKVEQGEYASHVYTFTNTGEAPLIISSAKGSCGCTVPKWPQGPILPGETASITVQFDSKGKMGFQNKKVTIIANTDPQQTFVYMKGEIVDPDALPSDNRDVEAEARVPQPDCFKIVPNPTAELLTLKMDEARIGKPVSVGIYSTTGQLMAQRHIPEAMETIEFEVTHYPAGIYVAKVQTDEGVVGSQCFVVTR
jgi:hypothetical protein